MSVINVRKKELNKNGYNDFEHWDGIGVSLLSAMEIFC
jgi:hypothetical protein